MKLLLDTHIFLWWMLDAPSLTRPQHNALVKAEKAQEPLHISAITLWEIAKLAELRRFKFEKSMDVLFKEWDAHPMLITLPLSSQISLESTRLGPEFHRDPSDQIIVATARVHGLRLITSDTRIIASALVPTIS